VTNHLWQSTWFAIAAGLVTLAFRKNRAQVRYWLWFAASAKFLVPFTLLMSVGGMVEWTPASHAVIAPSVAQVIVNVSEPFSRLAPLAPAVHNGPDFRWLVGLWACGLLGVAWMRFRGWVAIRAVIRSSAPVHLPAIPANIEVRSSPGMLEPSVIGWLHPVLLLPVGIGDRLTARQFDAVLQHELCHIRRRDNLTSAIHMLVEMLFWFHPLVWWIGARMMEERERACDEAVLSQGSEPSDYAEGILSVCTLYVGSPLRSAAGVTGSDLKKRIQAILTRTVARDLSVMKKAMLGTAVVAAVVLPVWVGIIHTSSVRAQSADSASGPRFEVASIRPCASAEIPIEGGDGKRGLKCQVP
jgi:beta-lactamase regulating signal transducer with metallopeptidase domain